eukprot:SAG22_NODE_10238_length_546_cov_0.742729_1_plen_78_part_00
MTLEVPGSEHCDGKAAQSGGAASPYLLQHLLLRSIAQFLPAATLARRWSASERSIVWLVTRLGWLGTQLYFELIISY